MTDGTLTEVDLETIKIVGDQSRPGFEVNIYWSKLRDDPEFYNNLVWLVIRDYAVETADRRAWFLSARGQRVYDEMKATRS